MTLSKKELRLINALESMTNLPEILGKALEDSVITQTYMKQKVEEYFEKQPETADIFYKALQQIGQEKITQQVKKQLEKILEERKPCIIDENEARENYNFIDKISEEEKIVTRYFKPEEEWGVSETEPTENIEEVKSRTKIEIERIIRQKAYKIAKVMKADAIQITTVKEKELVGGGEPDNFLKYELQIIQNITLYKRKTNQ
ncbi:MAG: hypothetical protein ABIC91_02430 [Nanoarchaeota archaeon]